MIYLLPVYPKMLMPAMTENLLTWVTMNKLILNDSKLSLDNEEVLRRKIIDMVQSSTITKNQEHQTLMGRLGQTIWVWLHHYSNAPPPLKPKDKTSKWINHFGVGGS